MRTLRLFLTTAITVALLGTSVSAVLAQTDEERPGSGPVSATVVDIETDDWVFDLGPIYGTMYDWQMVIEAESSDPRLSGTWTLILNNHGYGEAGTPDSIMITTGAARLENEHGAWVGEVQNFHSQAHESLSLVVEGEGGYAGYGAMLELADREWEEFKGVVFEGGLPPTHEPVEPSAG